MCARQVQGRPHRYAETSDLISGGTEFSLCQGDEMRLVAPTDVETIARLRRTSDIAALYTSRIGGHDDDPEPIRPNDS